MVDKSSFVKMLLHVLNVETRSDTQSEHWEEQLTASGACNASGVVDVKHFVHFCLPLVNEAACHRSGVVDMKNFVALCLQRCVGRAGKVLGVCSTLRQQEDERLAAQLEPSNEKTLTLSELSTAVIGEATPLPSLEHQT
eukprot:5781492-Amphidinium_carterae.1